MDKLEALYNSYLEQGFLSSETTLDQFRNAGEDQIQSLYETGQSNGLLSDQTDIDTFKGAWSLKKKDDSDSKLDPGSSEPVETPDEKRLGEHLVKDRLAGGSASLGVNMSSIGESIYNLFSIPQNLLSDPNNYPAWLQPHVRVLGIDKLEASADKFKEAYGIENKILEHYQEEVDKAQERTREFQEKRYENSSISENIKNGNIGDAFELLAGGLVESAPISLSMMAGGAATSVPKLAAGSTPFFMEDARRELSESDEDMSELEKTFKSLGIAGAETVFSSITQGSLGSVYKDIIKKEGIELGPQTFKNGLIDMYKAALKKYGATTAIAGEGIEEAATQITQNLIKGNDPYEGVTDAFLQGMGGGAVYGAPVNISNAKDRIETGVARNNVNKVIKDTEYNDMTSVFNDTGATALPVQIAAIETKNSQKVLDKELSASVEKGIITQEEANQTRHNYSKQAGIIKAVSDTGLEGDKKIEAITLLDEKSKLQEFTNGKDKSLVKKELDEIKSINEKLEGLRSAPEQTALDALGDKERIELLDKAGRELAKEKDGEKDFQITPEEIDARAIEILGRPVKGVMTERNEEFDNAVKENLPDSNYKTVDDFKETIKTGEWGMLTAENPNAKQVDDATNAEVNETAVTWLKDKGYAPQQIFGKYGTSENSFFVEGLTKEDAIEFAKEFKQETVATSEGLVYQDGSVDDINKEGISFDKKDDFYSTTKVNGEEVNFSIDYGGKRTGKQNTEFFTGKAEKPSSEIPYKPVIKVDVETPVAKSYDEFSAGGNFTGHISKMIAGFAEKQKQVAEAIVDGGFENFLDIGTSEGGLIKTVSANSETKSIGIDPNSEMKKNFESTPKVSNAEFKQEAFLASWIDDDGTVINEFKPDRKFDVVNEDFAFQFMNNDRGKQVSAVKDMMTDDGVFITSEKFHTANSEQNEKNKINHQKKYFSPEEITEDKQTIVSGMADDMVNDVDYFNTLKDNFKYVEEFWNAGDFKGYIASDNKERLTKFKQSVGDLTTEFTDKKSKTAGKTVESLRDLVDGEGNKKIMSQVENAQKALSEIAPDVKIETFNGGVNNEVSGEWIPSENTIRINLDTANERTVAHEVFHAVLGKSIGSDEKIQQATDTMLDAISSEIDSDLADQINEFKKKYKEGVQSEEALSELVGILASKGEQLTPKAKNIVLDWLNQLAKLVGLGKVTSGEVIDLLNTLSSKIASGEVIKEGDVVSITEKINPNAKPKNPTRPIKKSQLNNLKRHDNIKENTTEGVKLSSLEGKKMHLTFSDRLVTGFIDGIEYLGGLFYPSVTGAVWASNSNGAASKIINAMEKNDDGYRYLAIGVMKEDSHMSNMNMSKLAIEIVEKELTSRNIPVGEAYNKISKAFQRKPLSKYTEAFNNKNPKTIKGLKSFIDNTILSDKATFEERKAFLESVLGKADKNKALRFGSVPSYTELAKSLQEPVTENMEVGDVSVIVKTKGDLSIKDTKKGDKEYHPSYSKAIVSSGPVEVMVLDNVYDAADLFPQVSKKGVGVEDYKKKYGDQWRSRYLNFIGLGSMSTSVSDALQLPLSKKKQKSKDKINEIITLAKQEGYTQDIIKEFLIEKGFDKNTVDTTVNKSFAKSVSIKSKGKESRPSVGLKEAVNRIRVAYNKGSRDKAKAIQEAKAEAVKFVFEKLKTRVNTNELKQIITKVRDIKDSNFDKVMDVLDAAIDKINTKAEEGQYQTQTNALIKKVKKRNKKGEYAINNIPEMRVMLSRITSLSANEIPSDIRDQYKEILSSLVNWKKTGAKPLFDEVAEMNAALEDAFNNKDFSEAVKAEIELSLMDEIQEKKDAKEAELKEQYKEVISKLLKIGYNKNDFSDFDRAQLFKLHSFLRKANLDNLNSKKLKQIAQQLMQTSKGSNAWMPTMEVTSLVMEFEAARVVEGMQKEVFDKESKKISADIDGYVKTIGKSKKGIDAEVRRFDRMMKGYMSSFSGLFKKSKFSYGETIGKMVAGVSAVDSRKAQFSRTFEGLLRKIKGNDYDNQLKLALYAIEKRNQANPNNKNVFSAKEHIEATKKDKESNNEDADHIQKIFDKWADKNGEIDVAKIEESMTPAEKKLVDFINIEQSYANERRKNTSRHYEGTTAEDIDWYTPLVVKGRSSNLSESLNIKVRSNEPSAGSSNKTLSANKANPISLDYFKNIKNHVVSSIEYEVMMPIFKQLEATEKAMAQSDNKAITDWKRIVFGGNAQDKGIIRRQIEESNIQKSRDSEFDKFLGTTANNIMKFLLLSVPRLVVDATINQILSKGLYAPAMAKGIINRRKNNSGPKIKTDVWMSELFSSYNSEQSERSLGQHTTDGHSVQKGLEEKNSYKTNNRTVFQYINDIFRYNVVNRSTDRALEMYYSLSDQPSMEIWRASFSKEFPTFDIGAFMGKNKLDYREKYDQQIKDAIKKADSDTKTLFNTPSSAAEMLVATRGKKKGLLGQGAHLLLGFKYNEHHALRESIYSLMPNFITKKGQLNTLEAAKVAATISSRAIAYTAAQSILGAMIVNAFAPPDEEDEERMAQILPRSFAQFASFTVLGSQNAYVTGAFEMVVDKIRESLADEPEDHQDLFFSKNPDLGDLGMLGLMIENTEALTAYAWENVYMTEILGEEPDDDAKNRMIANKALTSMVALTTGVKLKLLEKVNNRIIRDE